MSQLGVLVILAADVSNIAMGLILTLSVGVYVFVATTECQP